MKALFDAAPEYLTGPNNRYLLNASVSSSFPQLESVDKNNNNWILSNRYATNYSLPDDGQISLASVTGFNIYKITRPRPVPLKRLDTDPRYIMDMILQNIRSERILPRTTDRYRILSYGDPRETGEYRDALGRTWITAAWLIEFNDTVRILYILPLPDGPVVISTVQTSSLRRIYEWDLRKLCDHTQTAYSATLEGWDEFIALNTALPGFLGDFKFNWKSETQEVSIDTGTVSVSVGNDVFEWSPRSNLFIAPCWYQTGSEDSEESESAEQAPANLGSAVQAPIEFGLRRISLTRDSRGRVFINLIKNMKPDPRRGAIAEENWDDFVQANYPYNEQPAISARDNTGSVGAILQAETPRPGVRYSLYLSMENPQNEENLSRRFNALKAGIRVKE
ncbi:hypothetical protein AGMMS50267_12520 [Spirochaetia bacterium]|nr:hypothetical protein AGMMS50267_12520 [Spirochaetia bacterium]